ncbi:unnamed protein product [Ectocarpus sp. 8 AP-2014]
MPVSLHPPVLDASVVGPPLCRSSSSQVRSVATWCGLPLYGAYECAGWFRTATTKERQRKSAPHGLILSFRRLRAAFPTRSSTSAGRHKVAHARNTRMDTTGAKEDKKKYYTL